MAHIQTSAVINAPRAEVFGYVSDLKHLPEWLGPSIQVGFSTVPQPMSLGTEYAIQLTRFGISRHFIFRIDQFIENQVYTDRQVEGFFSHWFHTQNLSDHDDQRTLVTDIVEYTLPFGLFGSLADDLFMRQDLARLLEHRYDCIRKHFEAEK